ncbi:flavin reductase family protein [Microvirga sp. W0021]|uniref:Flavin reductase family protein n=1 Tax=Hohaiivirga grylli TaxID=3133970 RepID=A0ABV0BKG4_9HYPH
MSLKAEISESALSAVDPKQYREGMSRLGAAVSIVTTQGKAGQAGLAATAVTSVTDQPATLIVCINSLSRSGHTIEENEVFAVNVLSADDQYVAEVFGGYTDVPRDKRFDVGEWQIGATGVPVLKTAIATFECRVTGQNIVASHRVLLGEVVAVHLGQKAEPLMYFDRDYRKIEL